MEKLDKEIQDALDNDLQLDALDEDNKAYLSLYEILSNTPTDKYLPSTFTNDVVSKIKPKKDFESAWWLGSMIIFILLTCLIVMVLTMGTMKTEVFELLSKYFPITALTAVMITVIQYLDRRLVKVDF